LDHFLKSLSLFFMLHAQLLAEDLGAAMGVCFADSLFLPCLGRKG
jgi:hypothetical protein